MPDADTRDLVPFHEHFASLKTVSLNDDLAQRVQAWLEGKGPWPEAATTLPEARHEGPETSPQTRERELEGGAWVQGPDGEARQEVTSR